MNKLYIPNGYISNMNVIETEIAIKKIKDFFQIELANKLSLTRVSAPLFVPTDSGLNDNLNGYESPVEFDIKDINNLSCQVVHSLAKWKRMALGRYKMCKGSGLYTDMNAIRRTEILDNLHSIYVDQWDWEVVISKEERNFDCLKSYVDRIYSVLKSTENYVCSLYKDIMPSLPKKIKYISSQDLLEQYPKLSSKEREHEAVKKYGAIFIIGIGGNLTDGNPHDNRAPDYDDWDLNGDIIFNYPLLNTAFEISSMGIRVDKLALKHQLESSGHIDWINLPFQQSIMKDKLPLTIGGGIGQSRLCMYFLNKAHIGEVQVSSWSDQTMSICKENSINLL